MNRDEKVSKVSALNETFSKAKFAVVTDYRGLKVTEFEKLRSELRKSDAQIQVAIKRIFIAPVAAAVEDVLCVEQSRHPIRDIFEAEGVMAPDHGRPVLARPASALLQGNAVRPAAHDARPDAHGPNQLLQV